MLGSVLADRGHHYEVVAIGGGALQLIGIIDRPTQDLDLVALRDGDTLFRVGETLLPAPLVQAIADVARVYDLATDWVNGKPGSLIDFGLPEGFLGRLERRVYGGLGLSLASRYDQIHFKLYAAADGAPGGKHHRDLQQLQPAREELLEAARWARTHDPSEGFALMVTAVLRDFGVEAPSS